MQAMWRRLEILNRASGCAPRTTANQTPVRGVRTGGHFSPRAPLFGLDDNHSLLLPLVFDVPYPAFYVSMPVQIGGGRPYRIVESTELVMNVWGSFGCHAQAVSSATCPLKVGHRALMSLSDDGWGQ